MSKGKEIASGDALDLVQPLLDVLGPTAKIAGSLRRGKERVHDVDVVVAEAIDMKLLRKVVTKVVEAGTKKVRVKMRKGLQVDIVITDDAHHGAAWLYLTGPREFNLAIRAEAKSQGFKLNEKGLWKVKGKGKKAEETLIAAETEREIFKALDLKFIFPPARSAESLHALSDDGVSFDISSKSDPSKTYKVVFTKGKPRCPCRGFAFSSSKKQKARVPKGYSKWCSHCTQALALFTQHQAA